MKFLLFVLLVALAATFSNAESSCDVAGLAAETQSACQQDCENTAECLSSMGLLLTEAQRCGCDSECERILEEANQISSQCASNQDLEEDDDEEEDDEDDLEEDEDDEEFDEDEDDEDDLDSLDKKKKRNPPSRKEKERRRERNPRQERRKKEKERRRERNPRKEKRKERETKNGDVNSES